VGVDEHRAQSRPSVDVYQSPASKTATIAAGEAGRVDGDVAPKDAGPPSDVPDADEVVYADYPAAGDTVGSLSIPALKQTFTIIEGTSDDELKRGVGHFSQSVLLGCKTTASCQVIATRYSRGSVSSRKATNWSWRHRPGRLSTRYPASES